MNFIAADPTEERHLPSDVREHTVFVKGLEALTGGDFVITPSKIPITESTLRIHVAKGLVVQRKNIGDLVASFQDEDARLWRQLIRMKLKVELPWLLVIGDLKAKNGVDSAGCKKFSSVVDGRESKINYMAVIGALEAWQRHGGYYSWISRDSTMLAWCELQYRNLVAKERRGGWGATLVKRGIVKPLELLTEVETTLSTIPGLGPERARAIYEETKKYVDIPNITNCICVVRDRRIDGIGPKIRGGVLEYFGWGNGDVK